jgi:hypothetical protein
MVRDWHVLYRSQDDEVRVHHVLYYAMYISWSIVSVHTNRTHCTFLVLVLVPNVLVLEFQPILTYIFTSYMYSKYLRKHLSDS